MAAEVPVNRILAQRREFAKFSRQASADGASVIGGYVGSIDNGVIRLQIDVNSEEYLDIPREAIDCVWQPHDEHYPTLFVLRSLTGVTRNGREIVEDAPFEHDPATDIITVRLFNNGGGSGTDACAQEKAACQNRCEQKHPSSGDSPNNLNSLMRQGCNDSCDAAERNCKFGGGGSFGGGGFIA
jgi:hypothetical protein